MGLPKSRIQDRATSEHLTGAVFRNTFLSKNFSNFSFWNGGLDPPDPAPVCAVGVPDGGRLARGAAEARLGFGQGAEPHRRWPTRVVVPEREDDMQGSHGLVVVAADEAAMPLEHVPIQRGARDSGAAGRNALPFEIVATKASESGRIHRLENGTRTTAHTNKILT